ncbi:HAD family hydrolase [Nonomuraea sp. NPDC046802]|uniref:D-glycero-alpha-D-manno-heptose-1,7-bisphosphate 7-phosphatase n=1 Tax=Nonomuraea sp. NPDC046802 TaxID=3154919 RepID=UPI0033F1664A
MSDQPRVVLLDRDGVLNRQPPHGYLTSHEQWQWLPGAREACARLTACGHRLAVVTNQSAVARGLLRIAELDLIHRRMCRELAEIGVQIWPVLYCPHHPREGCPCRKPEPGMLLEALRMLDAAPDQAVMVGDHTVDLEAANRVGCRSVHVRSGRGHDQPFPPSCMGSVADLIAAVPLLTG